MEHNINSKTNSNTSSIGYIRDCPTCDATGINSVDTSRVCPKCNGEKKVGPRPISPPYNPPQPIQPLPQPIPKLYDPYWRYPLYESHPTWRVPLGDDTRITCKPNMSISKGEAQKGTICWN